MVNYYWFESWPNESIDHFSRSDDETENIIEKKSALMEVDSGEIFDHSVDYDHDLLESNILFLSTALNINHLLPSLMTS